MSQQAIVHAYRHLYRHSLRAIQFSKPARYTLRDRIRLAFRKGSAADYEPQRIRNTLEFLQYAIKESGLEHKIVKNLMFVWHVQDTGGRLKHIPKNLTRDEIEIKTTAYDTFNHNIRMLNESMGLCLPAMTVRDPS
ncbi:hypothetical protein AA0117_g6520 [Alternaria alternata]|uniref:DUF1763-domain-containing protein n=2 Tax=Alternaria alternata complex TaxID=187734 RepID=A0A4Q4NFM7_ALTAL|nr:uncharacterized protein J4E82_002331 [Alternaria postmessia]KAH6862147.1 hypothetical protein B0T12DRAFT_480826 [Alternaria alternata]RYN50812.1 hypothetical protein AA0114_g5878 [Alternaria tenuissima]KAI5378880.1 hypothetical protein J4E82_002331 [Alternaria postmessia]OWY54380.1 DUF1763-like protein [Alternaria alternata]RYN59254.1 hypothetical protein AA0118_g6867 [Alternaria tenuissima]